MKKSIVLHLLCLAMLFGTALLSTGCATLNGGLFKGLGGPCAGGT